MKSFRIPKLHPLVALASVVGLAAAQMGASCDPEITVGPVVVESVDIVVGTSMPSSVQLDVGGALQLTLTVRDESGRRLDDSEFTAQFSTSNSSVATVSASGSAATVTAHAAGSASITATVAGIPDVLTVEVRPAEDTKVASIVITPNNGVLIVGTPQQFSASLRNAAGVVLAPRPVQWRVTDASVASVSADGLVTPLAPGITGVVASLDGVEESVAMPVRNRVARIEVDPASVKLEVGGTEELDLTFFDAQGVQMSSPDHTRSSSDNSVATIGSSGTVTAVAIGTATITFRADDVVAEVPVTVVGPVTGVSIDPAGATLKVGETQLFTADVQGGADPVVQWSTSDASVATVGDGLVTAMGSGSAEITATVGTFTAKATVTVEAGEPVTLVLNGAFRTIKRLVDGETETFMNTAVAGDHEENGDRSLQAFVTFDLTGAAGGALQGATLRVRSGAEEGNVAGLGTLHVELASGYALNEGALASNAVPVASGDSFDATVDVTALVRPAVEAGASSVILRLRWSALENGNGEIDYLEFTPQPLTLQIVR